MKRTKKTLKNKSALYGIGAVTLVILSLVTIGCSDPTSSSGSGSEEVIGRVSPVMTGSSTNSGGTYTKASVSVTLGHGEFSQYYATPWKVFDGNVNTEVHISGVSGYTKHDPNFDVTLLIDFGQDSALPIVTGFYIEGSDDGHKDRGPADMILYGSDDNNSWTELKEIEDPSGAKVYDSTLDERVTYRYYKLHITDNAHSDTPPNGAPPSGDKTKYDYGVMYIKEFYVKGVQ